TGACPAGPGAILIVTNAAILMCVAHARTLAKLRACGVAIARPGFDLGVHALAHASSPCTQECEPGTAPASSLRHGKRHVDEIRCHRDIGAARPSTGGMEHRRYQRGQDNRRSDKVRSHADSGTGDTLSPGHRVSILMPP